MRFYILFVAIIELGADSWLNKALFGRVHWIPFIFITIVLHVGIFILYLVDNFLGRSVFLTKARAKTLKRDHSVRERKETLWYKIGLEDSKVHIDKSMELITEVVNHINNNDDGLNKIIPSFFIYNKEYMNGYVDGLIRMKESKSSIFHNEGFNDP